MENEAPDEETRKAALRMLYKRRAEVILQDLVQIYGVPQDLVDELRELDEKYQKVAP